MRAEDERRLDEGLKSLLAHKDPQIRKRAALAAGRIGDVRAVPLLADMLVQDANSEVREMAAFALGEIESPGGAYALLTVLKDTKRPARARAVEALGKIVAAMPANATAVPGAPKPPDDDRLGPFREAILDTLTFETQRRSAPDRLTVLLGLTAALRAKPANAGPVIADFLGYSDSRIVADALNTLARLRLKDGSDQARELLTRHSDPIVRANAARLLGVAQDKQSFDALLDRALHDSDVRVNVSAIRALAAMKDARAVTPLLERGDYLLKLLNVDSRFPIEPRNEILEIATALGLTSQASENRTAFGWLDRAGERFGRTAPELEIAAARVSPSAYMLRLGNGEAGRINVQRTMLLNWRAASCIAQALGEFSNLPDGVANRKSLAEDAERLLRAMLDYRNSGLTINTLVAVHSEYAVPEVLRSYAKFKPKNLSETLRRHLTESDVIIRATAAELLGEQPAGDENRRALTEALPRALQDRDLNDAALAVLDALGKQKSREANDAIMTALGSRDHLIRRKAVALLKANGAGDFSDRIGTVQTTNTEADYRRAIARIGRRVTATVVTGKGSFTIEFLPADAPLTVDNFISLARKGFFNGQTIPRVVPNFVIQDGDPRGDQNGGPGYQIRCEINEVPYERAALGMALSGKDTGGSQWFVTHSRQPHLDGGYTVFGRVISGMDVVDRIARGDVIRQVVINGR